MPLPLLAGLGAGGAGLGASGAAGLGASAAGGPPLMAIFAVFSLLQSLGVFGGGDDEEQQRIDEEQMLRELKPNRPFYQSPFLATADKSVLETILARMGQTSNWGWPQGTNVNLPFLQSILAKGIGAAGGAPIRRIGQGQGSDLLRQVVR